MSNILDNLLINAMPPGDGNASHLNVGDKCAITQTGLEEHNSYSRFSRIGLAATFGAVVVPMVLGGGGIGVAFGGEAFGIGVAEQLFVGGLAGAGVGNANSKPIKAYKRSDKHETIQLVDMRGVVIAKRRRWFDQPGYDIKVQWTFLNESGESTTLNCWHSPDQLVQLTYKTFK